MENGVLYIYGILNGEYIMQKNAQVIMRKIGIKELLVLPHGRLSGNTIIATNGRENLTVSQLLKTITYLLKFIKDHFNVYEYKYSITIVFLDSLQLVLNNNNAKRPNKEQAHIIIDVIHEIADIHAKSDNDKKFNAEMAVEFDCLIETLK
jgi:hypothetical protein